MRARMHKCGIGMILVMNVVFVALLLFMYVFLGIPPMVELIPANGNDVYTVNPGREFNVTCQSTGQFSGEVQWLQANGSPVPDIGTK